MARFLVAVSDDEFLEWSTVVDAPVGRLLSRELAVEGYGDAAVERASAHGTSSPNRTIESLAGWNRAGPGESHLAWEELVDRFRRLGRAVHHVE